MQCEFIMRQYHGVRFASFSLLQWIPFFFFLSEASGDKVIRYFGTYLFVHLLCRYVYDVHCPDT